MSKLILNNREVNANLEVRKVNSRLGYTAWAIDGLVDKIGFILSPTVKNEEGIKKVVDLIERRDNDNVSLESSFDYDRRTVRAIVAEVL